MVLRRILFKLYHIQQSLDQHARAIREQNKTLAGLRQEQRKHEKALDAARAEQAKARNNVMQKEKRIKKAEKALETKVRDQGLSSLSQVLIHLVRDPIWYGLRHKSSTPSGSARRQNKSWRS